MILSYRDKRTKAFAAGEHVKAFSGIEHPARLKLNRIRAAPNLRSLAMLPGNRFESLSGDRRGQYSYPDQWSMAYLL